MCGFYSGGDAFTPLLSINNTLYIINSPPIDGIPLQLVIPSNNTNATKFILGPVEKQYVGTAAIFCAFSFEPPVHTQTAFITIVGECVCVHVSIMCTYVYIIMCACVYVRMCVRMYVV